MLLASRLDAMSGDRKTVHFPEQNQRSGIAAVIRLRYDLETHRAWDFRIEKSDG